MNYTYRAEHKITLDLLNPIKTIDRGSNQEISRIVLSASWVEADPADEIDRDGWLLDWTLRGFPLTSKGTRDKRVKQPEYISQYRYPEAMKVVVFDLLSELVERAHIDRKDIINLDEGPLRDDRYGEKAEVW